MASVPARNLPKPQAKTLRRLPPYPDRRHRFRHLFLRDLLPTLLILVFIGWISLQLAAYIAKVKPENGVAAQSSIRP
ncbi:hypothetical protein [Geoalkalibacter halelectricus]|uniref:Uncharacterized protein n=1 Tax=Geoalkalibacter halelectricus TaxID=2847045 RepID=A0ABY5ZT28_9BACT|nr:hypothetical protein [Geoalkalibacter halelectricus]MDO3379262.1 hypothetical protein [Geoalkalibacter halelectricus]UWZ81020.1 hypothetical protein L9S41_06390 [Geoalkalibacter halelectricus]